jgi:hypothetical protein
MSSCGSIGASQVKGRPEGCAIETGGLPVDHLLFMHIIYVLSLSLSVLLPGSSGGILSLPLRLERHPAERLADGPSPEGIHRLVETISRIPSEPGGLPDDVSLRVDTSSPTEFGISSMNVTPNEMTFFPI